ncbi:MAG TPA: FGGY-family carbohydrate kinase [Bacteroidales bacterium]|nr:FGGY-family carbohydrate kinase [Bacteroidales bacterium]
MNHFLGIDIGTGGCKAVVFDDNGKQVSSSYREYSIISSHPGWAELDTDEVISKCFDVIREAASLAGKGSVRGIGISSQGEAFTFIDRQGKAMCNALVSSDVRAVDLIRPWVDRFGEEKLYNITGHTPHPMFSLFKLLWMKENEPAMFSGAERILCFEDLLQYRLGIASPSMGWPLAGRTMLFDVITHKWDTTIAGKAGIDTQKLSRPMKSGSLAGFLNKDIAGSLGLSDETFIVTGGHDQPCSGLGAGAVDPGVAVWSSGSVECITPAFDRPVFTGELHRNNLCTYDHTAPGMYATVAFSLTGGNLFRWFRDQLGGEETVRARDERKDAYDILLDMLPDQPSRVTVLPYFTPSGTPYFDVDVKGTILGLDLSVTKAELLKGLLEGVAMEVRLNLEILRQSGYQVDELRIIGGGSKSEKHVQLKADATGMPVTILDVTEAGCMGVAMLAKACNDKADVKDIAREWVRPVKRIIPSRQDYYTDKFNRYKNLYPALKTVYKNI